MASAIALVPAACGWRALALTESGEASIQESPTFADAVAEAFALTEELRLEKGKTRRIPVTVALPTRLAVYERLVLPAEDREELAGMVRLQFEKSLPYPIEETAIGFQILSQTLTPAPPRRADEVEGLEEPDQPSEPIVHTTRLACGVHHPAAAGLGAPLLERQGPQRLTLWAMHVAAQAPAGATTCGLWREENDLVFAIFENRRLGFVELLASPEDALACLSRTLMTAEMAGAPVSFQEVLLDPSLSALAEPLSALLGAPIRELALQTWTQPQDETVDFTPESWWVEQAGRERSRHLRNQVSVAVAVYAALLLGAVVFLGIQGGRLGSLKKEVMLLKPQVDSIIDRQIRWKALTPAIDRRRFAVELLFQACQNLPSPETRITRFDLARNQIVIEGEALNAQLAISFSEKLKACPELSDFRFESGQPVILPNEHAQFRITGEL